MSFGENLKKFREEKQLGVNQLALKSGVSAAQISRFENGKRKTPHVDTAKKLAKALSVPLPLLIGESVSYDEWDYGHILLDIHHPSFQAWFQSHLRRTDKVDSNVLSC